MKAPKHSSQQAAALRWAFAQRTERPADHHILCTLAWLVSPGTFIAAPGVRCIVEITARDRKTVMDSLARLTAGGLIEVAAKTGKTRQMNAYRLAVENGERVSVGDA